MDWATIGLSVIFGAVVQTTIIVILYNHYIIPHIITGVKEQLMISIKGWVDEMTAALSDKIAAEINDRMLSLKRSVAGKRGRNVQLFEAAQSYLSGNIDEETTEEEREQIIADAIGTYGKPLVDAALTKLFPNLMKSDKAAAAQDPSAAGWC